MISIVIYIDKYQYLAVLCGSLNQFHHPEAAR